MALHGLRSLLGVLPNRFQITKLGIGNRELVSFPALIKHFSRMLSINLCPPPRLPVSRFRFCLRWVLFKKRASAVIKLYSPKYYFFK
ncbi:hypothetical protein ON021_06385, partial [Microcoleus sp. HI-ES]|nr:hypothetical protein [Microcoleus sp. HI-ES]